MPTLNFNHRAIEALPLPTNGRVEYWDEQTHASHMTGELGIPRLTVSKILNHQETGVTRVYDRHSYDKEKREALEVWNRLLFRIVMRVSLDQTVDYKQALSL
jgi:hypothetical protein